MDKLFKALLLGTAAGIIDAVFMLFMGAGWQADVAAFLHWVGVGLIIAFARLPLAGWLSGMIIGILTTIPLAFLVSTTEPTAWIPLSLSAAVLGSSLGYASEKLIPQPFE